MSTRNLALILILLLFSGSAAAKSICSMVEEPNNIFLYKKLRDEGVRPQDVDCSFDMSPIQVIAKDRRGNYQNAIVLLEKRVSPDHPKKFQTKESALEMAVKTSSDPTFIAELLIYGSDRSQVSGDELAEFLDLDGGMPTFVLAIALNIVDVSAMKIYRDKERLIQELPYFASSFLVSKGFYPSELSSSFLKHNHFFKEERNLLLLKMLLKGAKIREWPKGLYERLVRDEEYLLLYLMLENTVKLPDMSVLCPKGTRLRPRNEKMLDNLLDFGYTKNDKGEFCS